MSGLPLSELADWIEMMHRLQAEEDLRLIKAFSVANAAGQPSSRQAVKDLEMSTRGIRGKKREEVRARQTGVVGKFWSIMNAVRRRGR